MNVTAGAAEGNGTRREIREDSDLSNVLSIRVAVHYGADGED